MTERIAAELTGVPETALWTLYHRAAEARRPDTVLPDPRAVDVMRRVDYPWRERFGPAPSWLAQAVALRARCFDDAVRDFLHRHPRGTVIALGEGLETQFWRVDNGSVRWISVDLATTSRVRERLLASGERQRSVVCDVRDTRWMNEADAGTDVMITAQGLLMYLRPPDVRKLLADCARRFPGGRMVLDAVPRWFRDRTRAGRPAPGGHPTPLMHWAMNSGEHQKLRSAHPLIGEVRDLPLPPGRGFVFRNLAPRAGALPLLRQLRPPAALLRFEPA